MHMKTRIPQPKMIPREASPNVPPPLLPGRFSRFVGTTDGTGVGLADGGGVGEIEGDGDGHGDGCGEGNDDGS